MRNNESNYGGLRSFSRLKNVMVLSLHLFANKIR